MLMFVGTIVQVYCDVCTVYLSYAVIFFLIYLFVTAKAALPNIVLMKLPTLGGETSNQ